MSDERTIETGTDHLTARVVDRVAVLTLNRPQSRNAFSNEMLAGMALALDEADRASDVGCVVVTGAGGAFCAGGDVKGMAARDEAAKRSGERPSIDAAIHLQRMSQRATAGKIYEMPKPVIASLPGAAAGAGLAIALAADLRIAAADAFLLTAFARVGFSGDFGGTFFMSQLVGSAKARELYYLSDRVPAEEALRLGLVNWVVPSDQLEAETMKIATRLANGPTIAYRYMKENLNRAAMGGELGECLDLEATHHVHTGFTDDHKQATRAFVEKRTPVFKGR